MSIVTIDTLIETLLTSYHYSKLAKLFPSRLVKEAVDRQINLEDSQKLIESTWNLDKPSDSVITDYFWAYIKSCIQNSEIEGYTGSAFTSLVVLDNDKSGTKLLEGEFTYSKSKFWLVTGQPNQLSILKTVGFASNKVIAAINANGYNDLGQLGNYVSYNKIVEGQQAVNCNYVGIKSDNKLYISPNPSDYIHAAMFKPALILDGKIIVPVKNGWGIHPRTVIAQRSDRTILFLVTEHRNLHNIGVNIFECAQLLHQLGAVQAMNLDGGSSSTLEYKGKLITGSGFNGVPNAFIISSTQ